MSTCRRSPKRAAPVQVGRLLKVTIALRVSAPSEKGEPQPASQRSGRLVMPFAATALRTDRERAIASVEMLISKLQATAAAYELAGQVKRAQGRRRQLAKLRKILATLRDSPSGSAPKGKGGRSRPKSR